MTSVSVISIDVDILFCYKLPCIKELYIIINVNLNN